jgi:hypothetical protein
VNHQTFERTLRSPAKNSFFKNNLLFLFYFFAFSISTHTHINEKQKKTRSRRIIFLKRTSTTGEHACLSTSFF